MITIQNCFKLDFHMGCMVVRQGNVSTKIFLKEIDMLIIESTAVSITACLLNELVMANVKVIFCDKKRQPSFEMLPYYGAHNTSLRIREQIAWPDETKQMVWAAIVAEKIRKQAALLKSLGLDDHALLEQYAEETQMVSKNDFEGPAARVYFRALFGENFTRGRHAEDALNAALNYGYQVLLATFNREIAAKGYLTQLGLWHDSQLNPFNMGSDLMEPFRPLVDAAVVALWPEQFETTEKQAILAVLDQGVMINHRKENVTNAIKIYVNSVFDALNEGDDTMIRFYENDK
ncbi:MAG: type II CRISPR-associated endonuclease Cas1 [Peptococcaceae bacterium]|nr:type II CRISPR-associated endonuclease Cas1 [Peptococcaceae bacterium]